MGPSPLPPWTLPVARQTPPTRRSAVAFGVGAPRERPPRPSAPRTGWSQCCPLVAARISLGCGDRPASPYHARRAHGLRWKTRTDAKYAESSQCQRGGGRGGGTGKEGSDQNSKTLGSKGSAAGLLQEAGSYPLRGLPGVGGGGQVLEPSAVSAPLCAPQPHLLGVGVPPSEA